MLSVHTGTRRCPNRDRRGCSAQRRNAPQNHERSISRSSAPSLDRGRECGNRGHGRLCINTARTLRFRWRTSVPPGPDQAGQPQDQGTYVYRCLAPRLLMAYRWSPPIRPFSSGLAVMIIAGLGHLCPSAGRGQYQGSRKTPNRHRAPSKINLSRHHN